MAVTGADVVLTIGTSFSVSAGTLSLTGNATVIDQPRITGGTLSTGTAGVLLVNAVAGDTGGDAFDINSAVSLAGTTTIAAGADLGLGGGGSLGGAIGGAGGLELADLAYTAKVAAFAASLGELDVEANGSLALSGASGTLAATMLLANTGTIAISAGTAITTSNFLQIGVGALLDYQYNSALIGPGTIVTSGSAEVLDAGTGTDMLLLGGGINWTNTSTVTDYGQIAMNTASADKVTITNSATGTFILQGGDANLLTHASFTDGKDTFVNTGLLQRLPNSDGSGAGTISMAALLNSTGTIDVESGTLALTDGGTLSGSLSGAGTLLLYSGNFLIGNLSGSGHIATGSNAVITYSGSPKVNVAATLDNNSTLTIASGTTVTYANGLTIGDQTGGVTVTGGGTLATTGPTTVTDAGLTFNLALANGTTWANSGTVTDGGVIVLNAVNTGGDSAKMTNAATGSFTFAGDHASIALNSNSTGTDTFSNAGTLAKTSGSGTNTIAVTLNNTGTINVATGTISAQGDAGVGGAVGGTLTGAGTLQLAGGAAFTTGGIAGAGNLAVTGGASLTGTFTGTIADSITLNANGAIDSAAGKITTLSGPVTMGAPAAAYVNPGYFSGAGTIATTGTVSILDATTNDQFAIDGGATWANSGTVSDYGDIAYNAANTGGDAGTIINKATGNFSFTSDDANVGISSNSTGTDLFANQGVLAKTSGTGTNTIGVAFTDTGTVNVTSGTIGLAGGGSIAGTLSGAGTLETVSNAYTIAGVLAGAGTLALGFGSTILQATGTKSTISTHLEATGAILSGGGTLTTTGALTIDDSGAAPNLTLTGGVTWVNSGIVTDNGVVAFNAANTGGDVATITNTATGVFNLAGDDAGVLTNSNSNGTDQLTNAGLLAKTSGTGTSSVNGVLTNTGTINVASGFLAFTAGGALGGTLTGSGTAQLYGGAFTTAGIAGAGTLAVTNGASLTGTITGTITGTSKTQTVASSIALNGGGALASASGDTLVLSGTVSAGSLPATYLAPGIFTGSGTISTGSSVTILDNPANAELQVNGGITWLSRATVNDTGLIAYNAPNTGGDVATIVNAATGTFNFTTADAGLVTSSNSNGSDAFSNLGTLAKISSTGTNVIAVAFASSGIINVATGTIDVTGSGGALGGAVTGAGTLRLDTGAYTTGGITGAGMLVLDNLASITGTATGTTLTGTLSQTIVLNGGGGLVAALGFSLSAAGAITSGETSATYTDAGDFSGSGTIVTTNLVTVLDAAANPDLVVHGGVTWSNVSKVNDAGQIAYNAANTGGDVGTIVNQAGANFDFTTDDAGLGISSNSNGSDLFSNLGTLAKTGGTGTNTITVGFSTAGLVNVAAGAIVLTGGGTLGGQLTGAGTLKTLANSYTLAAGGVAGAGTLTLAAGTTLNLAANATIATTLIADGVIISSGSTVTTSGATGIVDLGASVPDLSLTGGVTWLNAGTATDNGFIGLNAVNTGGDTASIVNQVKGTLALGGPDAGIGISANSNGSDLLDNAGLVIKTGSGLSSISVPLLNTGAIEANTGSLALTGMITGTGNLKIDAGATLEVGSLPTTQHVSFTGGAGATLKLDTPASIGSLTALTAGDRLDLVGLTVTAAKIAGTTLTVTAGGVNTTYVSTGLTGEVAAFASDQNGGSFVSLYRTASATHAPEPLAFGNHHVGDSTGNTLALTVSNTAISDGYSEKLNAGLGSATTGFSAAGTVTAIAAGASNSNSLTAVLDTSTAGTKSGTATLMLASNGAGVDGRGATALASQTVNLTGAVYNFAAAGLASTSISLGNQHVGGTLNAFLTLTNTAAAGSYSEGLDATFTAATGSATGTGTASLIAAGASNSSSLSVGLSPAAAGAATGTETLAFISDGTGTSGLGTTSLGTQAVSITGTFYNLAAGKLAATTIAFGNHHVGDTVAAKAVSLTNSAPTGAFSEKLNASLTSGIIGVTAAGSITGLAAGAANATTLKLTDTATTAGSIAGKAALGLVSDGTGIDGLGTTSLLGQTITVTGGNFALASGTLASTNLNLGIIHAATAATGALSLTNGAPIGGFGESLDAGLSGASAGLSTAGSITGLLAGATNSSVLQLTVTTATTGVYAGTANLGLVSDGAGTSGLGTTSLGTQAVNVTATVDNFALAALEDPSGPALSGTSTSETLNLGSTLQGNAALTTTIGVLNAATALADQLGGTLSSAGATAFTNSGLGTFALLSAGQDEHAQTVSLATGTAGTFSETVTLSSYGTNASGYLGALTPETLTIIGTITPSVFHTYTLALGPNTITGADGLGDIFVASSGALNTRDKLTGGSGANSLVLNGAGLFDINAPSVFTNIPAITAFEGQAASGTLADTRQVVLMRDSATETLSVTAGTAATGNTNPEAITIYAYSGTDSLTLAGGADQVFLGSGNATVKLGGIANSVIAGSGIGLVTSTAALASASVVGTSTGMTTLEITTGGNVTLNTVDTYLTVKLDVAGSLKLSPMSFVTAIGSSGVDTLTAMGGTQTLTGGTGKDMLVGYSGGTTTFADTAAGLAGDTIQNWTTGDVLDLKNIVAANLHPLTYTANTLTVTDGTNSASITFSAAQTVANFTVTGSDGAGGTLIAFHP